MAASWRDAFQFVKVARFWRPAIIVHLRFPTELSNRVSTHDYILKERSHSAGSTRQGHANKRIIRLFERTRSITKTLDIQFSVFLPFGIGEGIEGIYDINERIRGSRVYRDEGKREKERRRETAILIYRSLVCSRREPPATSRVERLNIK